MSHWNIFSGEVNDKSVGDLMTDFFKQYNKDPKTNFSLYVSSTGGYMDSAIRFYDFIQSSGIKINTVGLGQVDSAAILLFLCGKERVAIENCRFRLHAPLYTGFESYQLINVHAETLSVLRYLDERYFEILKNELPKMGNVREAYNKGDILDPKRALEMGIVTKIEKKLPSDKYFDKK